MEILKTEGLVLNKKKINDVDVLITVYTKDYGKISIYVYGILKSKKRDKQAINVLNCSEFVLYKKNDSYLAQSFYTKKMYRNILLDITKLEMSLYFIDSINQIYDRNIKNEELYERFLNIFKYIDDYKNMTDDKRNYFLLSFLKRIMKEEGIFNDDQDIENKDCVVDDIYKYQQLINEELQVKLNINKLIYGGLI